MATADEQRHAEMVEDHEKRLRAIERDLAELKPPEKDTRPKK